MKGPISTPSLLKGGPKKPQEHPVMQMKGGPTKPQGRRVSELPTQLHPYELERLKQCMSNSKRMEQLGLPSFYFKKPAVHVNKNKSKQGNTEDSDSEYDPLRDDTVEGDLFENNAKGSKEKTCKKTKKPTSDLPRGGVKFRSRKRVFPDMPSIGPTKSQKKRIAQPDASVAPSEVHVPNVSQASLTREVHLPNVSQAVQLVGNFDVRTQDPIEDDGLNLPGDNTHMTDEPARHNEDAFAQHENNEFMADGITPSGGQNQMNNEGEHEEWNRGVNLGHGLQRLARSRRANNTIMADGADGIAHSGGQNQMNNEGEEEEWNRGVNMGHGLQRLT
ncbi:unnamed protein product [Urochloa humidicola]